MFQVSRAVMNFQLVIDRFANAFCFRPVGNQPSHCGLGTSLLATSSPLEIKVGRAFFLWSDAIVTTPRISRPLLPCLLCGNGDEASGWTWWVGSIGL